MYGFLTHGATIPVAIGVISLGTGLVIGFKAGRKVERAMEDERQMNIRERLHEEHAKKSAADRNAHSIPSAPKFDHDAMEQFIADQEVKYVEPDPEPEEATQIQFAMSDEEWDYDREVKIRTEAFPYVLHKDEFYADEKNYTQITLTYYAQDNIMCDEDQTPVYNYHNVTGPLRFGHGSGDSSVFYVRNDVRRAEYEIIHDPGLFSVDVLGLDADGIMEEEIEHSRHSVRKFRME
jgi:hypothetical protein